MSNIMQPPSSRYSTPPVPESVRAADQYYAAIKNQDDATAFAYVGSYFKSLFSQDGFILEAQENDATYGKVSGFVFETVNTGDPATITLKVTRTKGASYTVHLELRQEGGAWKITAFDCI
jgi:hypothetical protein